jgi:hypothetical protein
VAWGRGRGGGDAGRGGWGGCKWKNGHAPAARPGRRGLEHGRGEVGAARLPLHSHVLAQDLINNANVLKERGVAHPAAAPETTRTDFIVDSTALGLSRVSEDVGRR